MKKSHVSFIIATALAAALLAGCGSSGSSADASGSGKAGGQTRVQEAGSQDGTDSGTKGALSGEITFWHSFTQGPRLETIQKAADKFMEENPDVKINIETFSWNDFYTKWTTGLASGNVPDMSTALPAQVAEMINADALLPVNDLIDGIGRDKFAEAAISEGTVDGNNYSVPLYRHAHVMWIRKDLLEKNGLEVPKTWDELYDTAKALTKDGVYGLSFPCGTNDFQATFFLDFYVRSGGGSLLTDDLKANLT
ncbi:MAG: extracellular solute-binding protein, partial [Enterocloster sp.]|nr:extracellular solute-binding protein [Enterocloster sp.]